ncbi:hypothetical protein [Bradyrhizobium sp. 159]|nr:hypothetical protein [Bradyrhizobium sp. 159]
MRRKLVLQRIKARTHHQFTSQSGDYKTTMGRLFGPLSELRCRPVDRSGL